MRLGLILKAMVLRIAVETAKSRHVKLHPLCECCGAGPELVGRNNDVHHVIPVHVDPSLATVDSNLITLCHVHHWLFGHFKNWRAYNLNMRATTVQFRLFYEQEKAGIQK